MPPKRRNRDRVQCMTCQAVINGDEQASHRRRIHQNAAVKFKIYLEDSKQQKLCFGNSSKSKESNDMEDVDIISPAAGDVEMNNEPNDLEGVYTVPQVEGDEEMTVEGESTIEVEGQSLAAEPFPSTTSHDKDQRVDEVVNDTIHEDDGSHQDDHETEVCQTATGIPKEPFQPVLAKYHPIEYGKHTRDFLPAWYKQYPWLEYDVEAKSGTCYSCKYFSAKPSTWFLNKWKQTERMKLHANSNEHLPRSRL